MNEEEKNTKYENINKNVTNSKYEIQLVDRIIIAMIFVASIIVVIITIIVVNHKYQRYYEEQMKQFSEIPYNETYKYLAKDDAITFYKGVKEISKYECIEGCKVTDFASNQFIIDNDDLIPIFDGNQIKIYSISNNETSIVLDTIPQTSINNKYGIIRINGKYGIINKKGEIVLQCAYNDVDINTSHIAALNNNVVYVLDNNMNLLASKPVTVNGEISISEKQHYLYINIFSNTATTLIFDTTTNKFVN